MVKRLLLALILVFGFSCIVFSSEDIYFEKVKKAAEQGFPDSQFGLGNMYYEGKGVSQNYSEAFKWYKKAAEQGHAEAQRDLATMYSIGKSVPQNYAEAFKWYKKAAEQGLAGAQYLLALKYCNGEGGSKNYIEGYVWLSMASAKGLKEAKHNLSAIESKMTPEQIAEAQKKAAVLWEKLNKNKKN